jgi:Heavy-metal resistance
MTSLHKCLIFLLAALLAGLTGYGASSWTSRRESRPPGPRVMNAMPELEWLRRELSLTSDQYEQVRARHEAYLPTCAEMCRRIEEARQSAESYALAHHSLTPEYREVLDRHAQAHVDCQQEMLKHLYATAALLQKEQAGAYLEMMLPYALHFKHRE